MPVVRDHMLLKVLAGAVMLAHTWALEHPVYADMVDDGNGRPLWHIAHHRCHRCNGWPNIVFVTVANFQANSGKHYYTRQTVWLWL